MSGNNNLVTLEGDLINIKKVMSRSVIQYVFEIDKSSITDQTRHRLDDFQNGDTRLSIMVMPEGLARELEALVEPPAQRMLRDTTPDDKDEAERKKALVRL